MKCAIFKISTQRSSGNVPLSQSNESSDFTGFLVYSLKTSDKVVRYGENNQVEFSEHPTVVQRGNLVNRIVENFSKCACELINQSLTTAVFGIVYGILCCIFRDIRQESSACAVIGNKHTFNLYVFQIFCKFSVVVKEARGFNDNGFAIFLDDKHFIVDEIVGLVSVQFDAPEIINVHFTFREFYGCECVLVHNNNLLYMHSAQRGLFSQPLLLGDNTSSEKKISKGIFMMRWGMRGR